MLLSEDRAPAGLPNIQTPEERAPWQTPSARSCQNAGADMNPQPPRCPAAGGLPVSNHRLRGHTLDKIAEVPHRLAGSLQRGVSIFTVHFSVRQAQTRLAPSPCLSLMIDPDPPSPEPLKCKIT